MSSAIDFGNLGRDHAAHRCEYGQNVKVVLAIYSFVLGELALRERMLETEKWKIYLGRGVKEPV